MISLIQPNDEDFKTYHISINDLAEFIGINRTNAVREIDKATDRLMARVLRVSIEDDLRLLKLHWVSHCILDNATFEFSFHSKMKPYLLQFKKYFTSYQQKIIIQFSSSYTIRIYQLLKCWEFKGSFEYNVGKFREILGISAEKYKQFKAFKYWVITHAKKELEKKDPQTGLYKSDVSFTLETRRTGRKISHLKFISQLLTPKGASLQKLS
jgi:plasmid replication initiation protein